MTEKRGIAAKARYREGTAADGAAIRALQAAIYSPATATACEELARVPAQSLSLVAEIDGAVVGHLLLVQVAGPDRALALAPHAVLAAWRDMQLGTELLREALALARSRGWRSVFVYGQPGYYGRFGFKSRAADGADTACQGPRFLAFELDQDALSGWTGPLAYPEAFLAMAGAAQG